MKQEIPDKMKLLIKAIDKKLLFEGDLCENEVYLNIIRYHPPKAITFIREKHIGYKSKDYTVNLSL